MTELLDSLSRTTGQHQLVAECAPGIVVLADPVRLMQVLRNLVTNSIRYAPNGGRIAVRTIADPEAGIPEIAGASGFARVEVSDEGVGIPESDRDKVFEKFYRVNNDLRKRVRGTGLGLAICQAIVSAHGGRIWIERSEVGKGTTIAFTLPLVDLSAEIPEPAAPRAVGAGSEHQRGGDDDA